MGLTPITQGGIWKLRGTLAAESTQQALYYANRAASNFADAAYFGTQSDKPELPINTAKRGAEEATGGEVPPQGSSEKAAAPDGVKY